MTGTRRHLAIFVPSLRGGGAERVMVTLANGFAERGHRVDLVLTRAEGPYLKGVSDKIRVVDLDRGRVLASMLPLARYLRRDRPDAMLSALDHANLVAIWARMLARAAVRLVVSVRNAPSATMAGSRRMAIMRRLVQRFYPRADTIVCISEAMRQQMVELLPDAQEKLHTIYNPLDLDRVRRLMHKPVAHEWLTQRDAPVILAAGRLVPQKDYPTLLEAFAILRRQRPARLIILGEGELEEMLHQRAATLGVAEDVDFVGFQANPFAWMRAADLYVMSSAWEGLPNTLIEALACGVRIVSTDCPTGPREILENGRWGRLVPVGNAEAMAEAMTAALDGPAPASVQERAETFRSSQAVKHYEACLLPDHQVLDQ